MMFQVIGGSAFSLLAESGQVVRSQIEDKYSRWVPDFWMETHTIHSKWVLSIDLCIFFIFMWELPRTLKSRKQSPCVVDTVAEMKIADETIF